MVALTCARVRTSLFFFCISNVLIVAMMMMKENVQDKLVVPCCYKLWRTTPMCVLVCVLLLVVVLCGGVCMCVCVCVCVCVH